MGKLIRNGIEYGGGNGTDIFEVTQAEYDALVQAGTLVHNALYVITDAPNLNETAKQISYEGSTATVWDKVESLKTSKQDKLTITTAQTGTTDTAGNLLLSGVTTGKIVIAVWTMSAYCSCPVLSGGKWYVKCFSNLDNPIEPLVSSTVTYYYAYI